MTKFERVRAAAATPVEAASLHAHRTLMGALLCLATLRFVGQGWVDDFYVTPKLLLPYPGFEWLHPASRAGMYAIFAAMVVAAVMIMLGRCVRIAAAAFALLFTYVELLDQTTYLNHYYLVSLLTVLMAVLPVNRDVASVPRWWLWAYRAQVGLVYFYAGVAKLGADWLLHAQPMRIWLGNIDLPLLHDFAHQPWVAYAASWAGAVFDLTVVPLLMWYRSRIFAFAAVVAFHLITWYMFPIGMFPWIMMANATLFFTETWPSRWRPLLPLSDDVRHRRPASTAWSRWCVATFITVQLLVPLRHLAYPGNVLWSEEGLRFAWKVMVVEKAGIARFTVREPSTGRQWLVYPASMLTPRQAKMLAVTPELIRQFAHHLAAVYTAQGVVAPAVFAEVEVSLNGRRRRPLIASNVNLASEPFSWAPYRWILPAPPK